MLSILNISMVNWITCACGETLYNSTKLSFCWQTEPRLPGKTMENLELGVPHSCSQSYSQEGIKECSTIPKTALTKSNQTLLSIYLLFPLHSYESTDTITILPYPKTATSPLPCEQGQTSSFSAPRHPIFLSSKSTHHHQAPVS